MIFKHWLLVSLALVILWWWGSSDWTMQYWISQLLYSHMESEIELVKFLLNSSCFRAANQYGTSVFCTDFTCKLREYEFGLQNTEIELCQYCRLRYYCQNKAYLFWVANQSRFVVFYALKPSNTSLITKTFILLSSTSGSNTCSSSLPVPVVPKESTRISTGSQWVPPE